MFKEKITPATDLELYDLMLAAYPDTFDEDSDDNIWYEVMYFAEAQFGDIEMLKEFLGRLVLLTNPTKSPLTNTFFHVLGKVEFFNEKAIMTAAIKRSVNNC